MISSFRIKIFYFLTFFLYPVFSSASEMNEFSFNNISTEDGLSQKTVQAIYQDKNGFMWIGTQEGLNRFDGKKIKIFRHSNNNELSLSHDFIRDIIEDSDGNLLIATSGGLNRYIEETETFERLPIFSADGEEIKRLNTLYVDHTGTLLIGSDGHGLFEFDATSNNSKEIKLFNNLKSADIRVIFEDSRNRLWIGTDGDGVSLMDSDRKKIELFQNENKNKNSLSHNNVRTITEDSKGKIWIGTRGGGVNKFDELSRAFYIYLHDKSDDSSLSHNRVYKILEDNDQTLWIATDAGISLLDIKKDRFLKIKKYSSQRASLSHNRILTLYQDKGNLMWVGTSSGISLWSPVIAKFKQYKHLPEKPNSLSNSHIVSFAEDNINNIYVATFGGGLNYLDFKNNQIQSLTAQLEDENTISDNYLTTLMYEKNKSQLWIGTLSHGVEVLNENNKKIISYKNNPADNHSLSHNGVTDILKDSDGTIWISTYRAGLNKLNSNKQSFTRYNIKNSQLENENIFQLMEDIDGYIWLATDGGGVVRLDKHSGNFTSFKHDPTNMQSLSGNTAYSMFQDSKGNLWIGTQGNGLNLWLANDRRQGKNVFKHYTIDNGLNGSTINAIEEDNNGYIWISTNNGVNRLDTNSNKIIAYNLANQIHYNELNQAAILKTADGKLYFGGLDGISSFLPSEIEHNQNKPDVILTNVISEGRELDINESLSSLTDLTLTHKDYLVSFEFAALDYSQPDKNQYQYKLEGLDSDWVQTDNLNRATFTNLPSGNYVLKVKGSNNDGLWSDESINLQIKVLPAPWLSWWALSIYASLFCLLLLYIIRSQAKKLANEAMFQQKVIDRVEEKTALYLENNEHLSEQLEQLKFRSNIDSDTGLPNQKYLSDLIRANLQWINQHQQADKSQLPKLAIVLIDLPLVGDNKEQYLKYFTIIARKLKSSIETMEVDFKILVRWSENQLGLIFYCNNESESERLLKILSAEINKTIDQVSKDMFYRGDLSMGYCLLPFDGVRQGIIETESLLMLTEHLLYLVIKDEEKNIVGITGANVKINNMKFKQIMAANDLAELNEIFVFASYL